MVLVSIVWVVQLTGCATPFRIHPSQSFDRDAEVVWWVAEDTAGLLPSIVGIEHRLDNQKSLQIVFTDRGVRLFRYRKRKLVSAGPPLPENVGEIDVSFLRTMFRRFQSWPNRAPAEIPVEKTELVRSSADIAAILSDHWPAEQVPPPDLPFRQLNAELEHHAHGIDELLELKKVF